MPPKARVLTPDELEQVERLSSVLTTEQLADFLGIARQTFYDIMERQPDVSVHYKRGKADCINKVADSLIQKAQGGDTASSIFYLKTQAGWKETSVTEHAGSLSVTHEDSLDLLK